MKRARWQDLVFNLSEGDPSRSCYLHHTCGCLGSSLRSGHFAYPPLGTDGIEGAREGALLWCSLLKFPGLDKVSGIQAGLVML